MNNEAHRSEYLHTDEHGPTANLNLTDGERTSLIVGIDQALRVYGVTRNGATFSGDYAPTSHVGELVKLARRLDAMACGRRDWNRR